MDTPERIHKAMFGKSGLANHPGNDNPEFKAGFEVGSKAKARESSDVFMPEWERRGRPQPPSIEYKRYAEWKRGYWAARMQKAFGDAATR